MKGYDAYRKYVAIKLHFQTNYDYFKFAGKAKVSRESYETRRDKHIFERLAKVYDEDNYELLLLANFLDSSDTWIGTIASEQGRAKYISLKKRLQSLQYEFKQNMERIKSDLDYAIIPSFDSLFSKPYNGDPWPHIVSLLTHQDITLESFIIMNKILNFLPRISKHVEDDLVWPEIYKLVTKYSPFVRVDLKPFKDIMKKTFLSDDKKNLAV